MKLPALLPLLLAALLGAPGIAPAQQPPASDPATRFILGPPRGGGGLVFDTPGSKLKLMASESGGRFDMFGLTFTQDCQVTILNDRTLAVDAEGILATDAKGKNWLSSKTTLGGQAVVCFFPTSEDAARKAAEAAAAKQPSSSQEPNASSKTTWTDAKGRSITAKLISHDARIARLEINGQAHDVPLANLSQEDRRYLDGLSAKTGPAPTAGHPARWQDDLTQLRQLLAKSLVGIATDPADGKLADSKAEGKKDKIMTALQGHQITWEITFRAVARDAKAPGRWEVEFDEGSLIASLDARTKQGDRPSKEEMTALVTRVSIQPSHSSLDQWKKLPAGQKVRCRGIIKWSGAGRLIYFGGNLQNNFVWMPGINVEDAFPVEP